MVKGESFQGLHGKSVPQVCNPGGHWDVMSLVQERTQTLQTQTHYEQVIKDSTKLHRPGDRGTQPESSSHLFFSFSLNSSH